MNKSTRARILKFLTSDNPDDVLYGRWLIWIVHEQDRILEPFYEEQRQAAAKRQKGQS